jgi:hypothetical protein
VPQEGGEAGGGGEGGLPGGGGVGGNDEGVEAVGIAGEGRAGGVEVTAGATDAAGVLDEEEAEGTADGGAGATGIVEGAVAVVDELLDRPVSAAEINGGDEGDGVGGAEFGEAGLGFGDVDYGDTDAAGAEAFGDGVGDDAAVDVEGGREGDGIGISWGN